MYITGRFPRTPQEKSPGETWRVAAYDKPQKSQKNNQKKIAHVLLMEEEEEEEEGVYSL